MEVSSELKERGVVTDVISFHTIKPFDYETLDRIVSSKKYIFTIEEHSIIGGLGSVVSEYIAESRFNPIFKRFALPDEYSHYVGSQFYIREKFEFTSALISNKILNTLGYK